jgi:hypothetical protein
VDIGELQDAAAEDTVCTKKVLDFFWEPYTVEDTTTERHMSVLNRNHF